MSGYGLMDWWRRRRGARPADVGAGQDPGPRRDSGADGDGDGEGAGSRACSPVVSALVADIGNALSQGDLDTAQRLLKEANAASSDDAALLLQLARAERLAGRLPAALEACDRALLLSDRPSAVQTERAEALAALPDLQGAMDALQVALELDETNGDAWLMLGQIFRRLGGREDALAAFERATQYLSRPADLALAWRQVGAIKVETVDTAGARRALEASLALEPDHADAHLGLGIAALLVDDEPGALLHFEAAVARAPRPSNTLLMNLAYALQHTGRLTEAHAVYSRLVALDPRDQAVRWYLCQLDLTLCNWRAGWSNLQSRFTSGAGSYRPIGYRPWDGRDIKDQTLLVLADEGLGDEIMYASCIPDAQSRAGRVILECEPRLLGLFSRSFPGVMTVATRRENNPGWLEGYPVPAWQVPSGALPGMFRLCDEDFPRHAGYLRADPQRVSFWRQHLAEKLGRGLKVGISWRGGTAKTRQRARTISAAEWAPILAVPGVQFVNLQYGRYDDELAELNRLHGNRIHDFPQALADYDETAALVQSLDLVISVCTAIVHLSGALGRPVWVLTPLVPGWRYTADRPSMPWYPSTRLFRQRAWGDWPTVCHEVSAELRQLTKVVTFD